MAEDKKLITLEQHDAAQGRLHWELSNIENSKPNGIECPKCKAELWDSDSRCVLLSNPPQKKIYCPVCGFRGFAIA